jgi:hypothetical protein
VFRERRYLKRIPPDVIDIALRGMAIPGESLPPVTLKPFMTLFLLNGILICPMNQDATP